MIASCSPLLTLMAERYWYLRAKSKEDLKTLRDDQRWLLTRVDYKSEAEATSARWRLENVLGIDLEVDSAMSEIA